MLILITDCIARTRPGRAYADRVWATCHVALIGLVIAGICLPHLRWARDIVESCLGELNRLKAVELATGKILFVIWSLGTSICMWRIFGDLLRTRNLKKSAETTSLSRWGHNLATQAQPKATDVHISSAVLNPCCWQVHRANILLPAYVLDLPEPQQRAIVKHELGHLQAGHPLHLFIQRICLALFWFHPLVRFSARRADLARELYCDRVSISHRREAVAYLSSLQSLTQASDSLQRKGFVLPFVTRRNHDLQRRITAITDRDWSCGANDRRKRKLLPALIYASAAIVWLLWLPVDADSSARSTWSPWPTHTANSIKTIIDYPLRDYELDGHRLTERLRHK